MRVLYDTIDTISMTNQDSSYPASNTQTQYQGQVAKSTTLSSVFTIAALTNGNALYIGNTNATSGNLKVYDDLAVLVDDIDFTIDHRDSVADIVAGTLKQGYIEHFQLFDTYQDDDYSCVLTLTSAAPTATVLHVGIIRTGFADHFMNPEYGWRMSILDTSIKNETNIGAPYVLNRSKVRQFSGQFPAFTNDDFYKFQDLYYRLQNQSTAFYFKTDGTTSRQFCFGKLAPPDSTFPSPDLGQWAITVTEVL